MEPTDSGDLEQIKINKWKKIMTIALILGFLLLTTVFIKAYLDGKFRSVETLQVYIKSYGIFGPVILIVFQAMQVIVPVLPGLLGCAAGAVLFGSMGGFWCNYLGISAGSIIAFLLAKKYGTALVRNLFSKEKYEKYSAWAGKSKSYTLLLFAGMVLPLFPDDFFCYFSGLTKMSLRKFAIIIFLGKPWCILAYSIFFSSI